MGRDEALTLLDKIHSAGAPRVAVVSGPAGIGKTAVALHWSHREQIDFPDGQLFADLQGHAINEPVQPTEVLERFIRAFGIEPKRIPPELAERSAFYQSLVSRRRLLVVLDNAASAAQVIPLLPASADSITIVTSRWRLAGLLMRGARGVQLEQLRSEAAFELLKRVIDDNRVDAERQSAEKLVELCARLPLALCITGARLATRPRWSLSEMVKALSHERQRLAELSVGGEDDMKVQATLALSYNRLSSENVRRLYRRLGLFPGTTFDSWSAAAMIALPHAQVQPLLEILTDANLLDDAPGGNYRFHDLIRLHAWEMAEQDDPEEIREQTVHRAVDWFLFTAVTVNRVVAPYSKSNFNAVVNEPTEPLVFTNRAQALNWLDNEFPNLRAAIRVALDRRLFPTAWQLVGALWPLFLYRGRHDERLEVAKMGLEAARACADPVAEAKMLNRTGLAHRSVGQLDEATAAFHAALKIWHRQGNRYRISGSIRNLGLIKLDRGHVEEAVTLFRESLDEYRTAKEPRKIALLLCDLSEALIELGKTAEAIDCLTEAENLLIGVDDPYNRARARILLGSAQGGKSGVALINQGLEEMKGLGSTLTRVQALQVLGDLALQECRKQEARDLYEEAQRVLSRSGGRSRRLEERLARLAQ
ncbi:ATP-binding protein [Streptosporangium saharense]|uniref:Tetratricopeptide (TPR) repeat protein/DNA-binding transcriptional ArsR family regulator n=1 Tax=Streptosporangium saharense TaxID=1706840 RepID=A0A7W7QSC9_9ACTN|nr:tetratricopeptide repeat protein [Streptosporangium saharense]MBB4918892.1 tetratricopeptide (TPR) repeat protein/DNA-binding transcriptional ArsR family regulator [Streptosporangium saharense]